MEIVVTLDVMMARRKISSKELAAKLDITESNLSLLILTERKLWVRDLATWQFHNPGQVRSGQSLEIINDVSKPITQPTKDISLRVTVAVEMKTDTTGSPGESTTFSMFPATAWAPRK